MDETKTWRDLLAKIISDPQEKQRIAQILRVNPVTLSRWCTGSTRPRYDNVRQLLEALPHYRQQFAEFLAEDFPQLFAGQQGEEPSVTEIPSAFYGRVLSAYTSSPPVLRSSTLSILILQQILAHIDPGQSGMAALILQCMKPDSSNKVRSLRKTYGRGALPWLSQDYQTQLFGAESQAGQAVVSGHPIIIQCNYEKTRLFPAQHIPQEEGCVAYPVMQADRTAGCLLIVSNQEHFFTQTKLDLAKYYADLLTLSFEPGDFYKLEQIELGIMPEGEKQQSYLAHFQERVTQKMLQSQQQQRHLTRLEAEPLVWHELEQELLELTLLAAVQ